jgi:hypothetical protein
MANKVDDSIPNLLAWLMQEQLRFKMPIQGLAASTVLENSTAHYRSMTLSSGSFAT